MSEPYPEESQKLDVIGHLEELRRRIWVSLGAVVLASAVLFFQGHRLMEIVKRPLGETGSELIFISPTEAFLAYVKVVILSGFIVSFPVILHEVWAFFSLAASPSMRRRIVRWLFLALGLFAAGISFSYFVAIPVALGFLLSFGSQIASPEITLGKYISFFGALILMGGVVFEIPVVLALLTDIGLLKSRALKTKRHYAIVVILIAAAVITPTQDVFNMLLFALPMALLYELGILISAAIERRKKSRVPPGVAVK